MLVENQELHSTICHEAFEGKLSVFSPLTQEEKRLLISEAVAHIYEKGHLIYDEGEQPQGFKYLVSGKAKITKTGIGGKEQIVRLSSKHSFIGYRALFAEEVTYATATALEQTTLLLLPFESVTQIIRSNPDFAMKLLRSFALDLRFAETRTVTLTQKHIRGRLAESLLLLVEQYGLEKDGETIQVVLSREDISKLSNMTPSNAIRTLSAFASERVIALEGRMIKVLNRRMLEKISNLG